jgi:hypothetical protein
VTQNFNIACGIQAHLWDEDLLQELTLRELTCLKRIMGFTSGSGKAGIIAYLISASRLRNELFPYWQNYTGLDWEAQKPVIQSLADAYKGKDLKVKCKIAHIYAPNTKWGMAGALISWVVTANGKGARFVKEQRQLLDKRPKQLSLPIAI